MGFITEEEAVYLKEAKALAERGLDTTYLGAVDKDLESVIAMESPEVLVENAFLTKLAEAEIIYISDWHHDGRDKPILNALLKFLTRHVPPQSIGVMLEILPAVAQPLIDRFMASHQPASEFLQSLESRAAIPFYHPSYATLLERIRARGCSAIGIDTHRGPNGMKKRDRDMAEIIASSCRGDARRYAIVFSGECHLAPSHLPALVGYKFNRFKKKSAIVFQSNERLYDEFGPGIFRLSTIYAYNRTNPVDKYRIWQRANGIHDDD